METNTLEYAKKLDKEKEKNKELLNSLMELVEKYEFNLSPTQKKNLLLDEEYQNAINLINKVTK